jgi:hypothetical protein
MMGVWMVVGSRNVTGCNIGLVCTSPECVNMISKRDGKKKNENENLCKRGDMMHIEARSLPMLMKKTS